MLEVGLIPLRFEGGRLVDVWNELAREGMVVANALDVG